MPKKSYRLAHLADTHVKNLKYHEEYREVFEQIFATLRQEKPDYIIHCGDIAHTKTQISPEFVEMAAWFLGTLADIAPTYVILGNHDFSIFNLTRQDAITPIVNFLKHDNLKLLKYSGEEKINDDITLNVLSIVDRANWKKPSDPTKINIALYHGAINGVKTDTGYVLENVDDDIDIFEGHDFAFLGDIHKTFQVVATRETSNNEEKPVCLYPGSTVQQNFGETNDKGFVMWDITDSNNFDVRHVVIKNPKPFITVELTKDGKLPKNCVIPPKSRLRLVGNYNLTASQMRKALDVAKQKFKPESLTFHNNSSKLRKDKLLTGVKQENLRDLGVQENHIKEFLKDYSLDKQVLDKVIELNTKYNGMLDDEEEPQRDVKWQVESFKWDNLFNYGSGNSIDFRNLRGVIGVFGKNFTGKSSTFGSLMWTLFNSTDKNIRKNVNVINQNKSYGSGELTLSIGEHQYKIERRADKFTKKLNNEETEEAKTSLNFSEKDMPDGEFSDGSLNGIDRNQTDKNIRRLFGTLDDFLFTSMSSQLGSLSFLSEGSTKRKEILGKFLDLDFFAKKHKMANDDSGMIKASLRKLEGRDLDKELEEATNEIELNNNAILIQKGVVEKTKQKQKEEEERMHSIQREIDSLPEVTVLDLAKEQENLKNLASQKVNILSDNFETESELKKTEEKLNKVYSAINSINFDEQSDKKKLLDEKEAEISDVLYELSELTRTEKEQKNKISLLSQVPCGDRFPTCKFLLEANKAKDDISKTQELIQIESEKQKQLREEAAKYSSCLTVLEKYEKLIELKRELELNLAKFQLDIEKGKAKFASCKDNFDKLSQKIKDYEKNKDIAEKLKLLLEEKELLQKTLNKTSEDLRELEEETVELYRNHGSLEQRFSNLEELKGELEDLRIEYSAYELFEKCMHSNGISYTIIKKRLPLINEEIAKILANIVEFEVFFEDDGKKLDILIKHPKYEPRLIEMGSGAEKMLAAMAIRLAFIKIGNLPKSNIFILDEPATALDEENMQGFISTLEMLKSEFDTVFLISHLDALKDVVDQEITIDKIGGYAHVEVK